MAEAARGIHLAVTAEQHHAGGLVEPSGLGKERGGLPELATQLGRACLREGARSAELPAEESHRRVPVLSPAAEYL